MKIHLNLASRVYINRRTLNLVYCAVIAVMGLLLIINIVSLLHHHRHSRKVSEILVSIPENRTKVRESERLHDPQVIARQVGYANEILQKRRFHWSDFLHRMESVLPGGVRLRSIQPQSRGGSVRLQGVARGVPELRRFLENLSADPVLNDYFFLEQAPARGDGVGDHPGALGFSLQLRGVFQP